MDLNQLKLKRKQLRRLFSKACNDFGNLIKDETAKPDLIAAFKGIEDKSVRLFEIDLEVSKTLFSVKDLNEAELEEAVEAEFDSCESYRDKWFSVKVKFDELNSNNSSNIQKLENSGQTNDSTRNLRLPKIQLKCFDGNLRNWIGFWGQFKKIHDDNNLAPEDKFQYLIQATVPKSAARELVESYPPSAENYYKAIEVLKDRFARDELLIEVYVRDLLNLVLERANKNEVIVLSSLYDKLVTQLQALASLGVTSEKYAAMLFPLAESALPEDTLRAWERHRTSCRSLTSQECGTQPTNYLTMLLDFLKGEVESEERLMLARSGFTTEGPTKSSYNKGSKNNMFRDRPKTSTPTASAILVADIKKKEELCLFCSKSSHRTSECASIVDCSLGEKRDRLRKTGGCFVCLKQGHSSKACKSFVKCLLCKKRHHTVMCSNLNCIDQEVKSNMNRPTARSADPEDGGKNNVLLSQWSGQTYLQTLVVDIVNPKTNECRPVRVLIDSGSQHSYISKYCVHELGLLKIGTETISHSLFGGVQTDQVEHNVYNVVLCNQHNAYKCTALVLDQDKICNYIPRFYDRSVYQALRQKGIILTDMDYDLEVEMLIGADIISKLLTTKMEPVGRGLMAVQTKLGWTLMGQHNKEKCSINAFCLTNLNSLEISQLWRLDTIGISDPVETKAQQQLENEAVLHFERTVSINEEGRYCVQLPWIEGHPDLVDNKEVSLKRLESTTKRLEKLKKLEDYGKVFEEWEELNIIEKVTEESYPSHFIPHHAVIKETSLTTKIRPVFDASAKDKYGNSLNKCLVKGPNFVELIPNMLIKFRLHKIGVTADIAKAFLQICIEEKDRHFLQFLWWKNYEKNELQIYRHCRVVFGLKSSPFLLGAVINHLLENAPEELRETAIKLKSSFYVDNCVTSVKNEEELTQFIEESKTLMETGKFDLRGWIYSGMQTGQERNTVSLLGLVWEPLEDTLSCNVDSVNLISNPITKRVLLSVSQKLFDPIGFTCPVSLVPKLLLQETWKLKIGWDTPLPEEITKQCIQWVGQIHLLNQCSVPRLISDISVMEGKCSLHVFSDASRVAYAACIFLRVQRYEDVSVRLVAAKSRIAPCKAITIPRLELLGALIATRLFKQVETSLEIKHCKHYFWTDSTVVLAWIKGNDEWNTFVANRCKEIKQHCNPADWKHISGPNNPADLPSRGCSAKRLSEGRWWEGPEWLREPELNWPMSNWEVSEVEVNQEKKKHIVSAINSDRSIILTHFESISKYSKIVRTTAWILRFQNNAVKNTERKTGELTGEEIKLAEKKLFLAVQRECFPSNVIKDKSLKKLQIFEDKDGILHIKSRLLFGNWDQEFKFPILLPSNHTFVRKLIAYQHTKHQHAGVQILLQILREEYWIIGGRKTVKSVLSKCVHCKRHNAKATVVPFAPLPQDRIKDSKVFEVTGVDMAGPLILKSGGKAWIVLFTCAVYRAVHLELTESLSTSTFLQVLRRFIARRGRVSIIYSDNGTNFTGASNAFNKLNWKEIIRETSIKKIIWKFNPPTAAWWGGWWERIIGMLKNLLRRTLGKSSLNYEELSTVLCDCEAVLNARPLTYVSSDADDLIPLSPSLFMQSLGSNEVTDTDQIDKTNLAKRWRYIQKMREDLRTRFRKEYLGMLVNYGQPQKGSIEVGDVVLIGSENLKRVSWPLGVVLQTFPGRDGITRLVRLKTASGEFTRPVQKLYPLEITTDDAEQTINNQKLLSHKQAQEIQLKPEPKVKTRIGRKFKVPKRLYI